MWPFRPKSQQQTEDNALRERECTDLVHRARAGDQIAMAQIVEIRENAKRNHPVALDSYRRIDRITRSLPLPRMGV